MSFGLDINARARAVGISTQYVDLRSVGLANLPARIAVIAQGSDAAEASYVANIGQRFTDSASVGAAVGFGSPAELQFQKLFPRNGDGIGTIEATLYPLKADGSGVAATADITGAGTQVGSAEYTIDINGIFSSTFVIADGEDFDDALPNIVAAVNGPLSLPMIASAGASICDLVCKWKGITGDSCIITINGPDNGIIFAITQPNGGLVNPDVDDALNQIPGERWETLIINMMGEDDTATFDKFQAFGDFRHTALSHNPPVTFTGSIADATTARAFADGRKLDKINSYIRVVGSRSLPFVIAAAGAARVALVSNSNPARDYAGQVLQGILPGPDADQGAYPSRDLDIKSGVSTAKVIAGQVRLADTVTFYHKDGEDPPAFSSVVKIVKLMQVIHNISVRFNTPKWDGAPLIPNDQPTTNRDARKPSDATAEISEMLDALGLAAIISDPDAAKEKTFSGISETNPDRLNLRVTVQISGNTNITDIEVDFGFFFGTLPLV